jgi:hypothetical protein
VGFFGDHPLAPSSMRRGVYEPTVISDRELTVATAFAIAHPDESGYAPPAKVQK